MGRKLNVALLLTVHLSFIACAVLIVGPLMTESSDQDSQRGDTIAANQPDPFVRVSTYTRSQESDKEVHQNPPYQQRLGQSSATRKAGWMHPDGQPQGGQSSNASGIAP